MYTVVLNHTPEADSTETFQQMDDRGVFLDEDNIYPLDVTLDSIILSSSEVSISITRFGDMLELYGHYKST